MRLIVKKKNQLRRDICAEYYEKNVLAKIWAKIDHAFSVYRESREPTDMALEESLRKKYDYYYNLQGALQGMDATMHGIRALLRDMCPKIPGPSGLEGSIEENKSTYALSVASIRRQQLKLPAADRYNREEFAALTRFLPQYDKAECSFFDVDVHKIMYRFVKSSRLENWREILDEEEKLAVERAKNAKKEAQLERLKRQGRKQPPPPPPMSPIELAAHQRRLRKEAEIKAKEEAERNRDDEYNFDPFKLRKKERIKGRRLSIGDPCEMMNRIAHTKDHIMTNAMVKRRNSLPILLEPLCPPEVPSFGFIPSSKASLNLFKERKQNVSELFDEEYEHIRKNWSKTLRKKRSIKTLTGAVLNPRLPIETLQLLRDGGRRRTIAEPERLERQLSVLFEVRNNLALSRKGCRNILGAPVRRRSFDHGEYRDEVEGITELLGDVDEPTKVQTMSDYLKAKLRIEERMKNADLTILQEDFDEKNDNDFEEFEPFLAKVRERDLARAAGVISTPKYTSASTKKSWEGRAKSLQPVIWQEHFTEESYTYYYQEESGESLWEMPTGNVQILSQYQDSEGNWYWFNNTTGETSWIC